MTDKQRDADLALIERMTMLHGAPRLTPADYLTILGNLPRLLALAREALTAREDTKRLDWLCGSATSQMDRVVKHWEKHDDIRAAIDAARAPRNPKGGE